ncbi:MAG: PQQ-binding-like beta-propeller repeat protein [Actinomycetota bacterium]|nr:PQQ-binding-like beta-propeller repeat protein [Actinomycetota bacterium]
MKHLDLPQRRSVRLATLVAGLSLLSLPVLAQAATTDWPTYHRNNFRGGNDTSASTFVGPLLQKWASVSLGGTIYAEPLLVGNVLIVADLNDTVTALNAGTGAIVWQQNVGNPVTIPSAGFPCGNISPDGIVGTPVVDPVAGIVDAVALEQPADYYLVGLDLQTGAPRFPQVHIAPPGFDAHIQQQRSALTLANGRVYVLFGGYIGDCGPYHGWVVGVPATGSGTQVVFNDWPGHGTAAGFWATAGGSVDGSGNLFVTSGNGFDTASFDNGETIFKLSPALALLDWWAPSQWVWMNQTDTDLGSVGPAIVGTSNNLVFQTGKSGWGYLVSTALSGAGAVHIGSEPFSGQVCSAATTATTALDQVFGGVAYADPYIYVPCPEGVEALKLAAGPSFSVAWSSASFHPGPPIVAGGVVWAMDTNNGSLFGLNPTTGVTLFSATNLGATTHFTTPTAGQGRIYVPVADQIVAFSQPRAERGVSLPAKPTTIRGSAPPRVPQSVAGPRPLVHFPARSRRGPVRVL